ncbi:MAG TPA: extracellular solute-binding protein [Candidatus Acidoferrales bacterium]|nr:extracellular solute-binding protein [Candidatus Acidoferrales bacterium]
MKRLALKTLTGFGALFLVFPAAGIAAEAKSWQAEWDKTVAAAKREGSLSVYIWQGGNLEKAVQAFQKKFPDIKLTVTGGRGSSFINRVASEIRAGVKIADVCICGVTSPYKIFYEQMKALDAISSALILPEVKDEAKWWQGKHHYQDPERKYLFIYIGSPAGTRVYYNRTLVDPKEFQSYWDVLTPKWKGKIVAIDPHESSGGWRMLYYHPELGPNYVRKLLGEVDAAFSRDERQATDWLAQGRYAISLFSRGVPEAKAQGLPVDEVADANFKEAPAISSGANGTIALMNNAPHPNAAKVFTNWFLSREGQIYFQEVMNTPLDQVQSMRADIPVDPIPPEYRRREGVRYVPVYNPDTMDAGPVLKLFKEIVKR